MSPQTLSVVFPPSSSVQLETAPHGVSYNRRPWMESGGAGEYERTREGFKAVYSIKFLFVKKKKKKKKK